MEGEPMQIFSWIAILMLITVALFAIQNSNAAPVMIKFLAWRFETSLVLTILGSIVLGILISILFWISRALRLSFKKKAARGQEDPSASRFTTKDDRRV
jgi:uncharacterized integral membrane protein